MNPLQPSPATSTLRLVFWEVTAGCNLECRHCRRLDISQALMENDLSFQEGQRLIEQMARCGQPTLVLSGGEPLMRPDIFDLSSYAKLQGLPVALATNGTLVTTTVARDIQRAGIGRVSISVDAPTADGHDAFRGQAGAFAGALSGIDRLKQFGVSVQINCTVTTDNVDQLDAMFELATQLEVDALYLFLLVPVGCGLEIRETHQLAARRYEEVLDWIWDRSQSSSMHIRPICAPHYFRVMRQRRAQQSRQRLTVMSQGDAPEFRRERASAQRWSEMTKGCLAGSAICFVAHDGNVFPCGYLPQSVGNVRSTPLTKLWNHAELFLRLRDTGELKGKCGVCEFRRICSGCRARAFAEHEDAFDEEPYCLHTPVRPVRND